MDVYLEHLVARLERAGGTLTRHWLAELPADRRRRQRQRPRLPGPGRGRDAASRPRPGGEGRPDRGAGVADRVLGRGAAALRRPAGARRGRRRHGRRRTPGTSAPTRRRPRRSWPGPPPWCPGCVAPRCSPTGWVCARPGRPYGWRRCRTRTASSGGVVHCYGHGGAGVTLSWGCADDVLRRASRSCSSGTPVAAQPRRDSTPPRPPRRRRRPRRRPRRPSRRRRRPPHPRAGHPAAARPRPRR